MINASDLTVGSVFCTPQEKGLFYCVYEDSVWRGRRSREHHEVPLSKDTPVELLADINDLARRYIQELEQENKYSEYYYPIGDMDDFDNPHRKAYGLTNGTVVRVAGKRGLFYIQGTRCYYNVAHRWQGAKPLILAHDHIVEVVADRFDLAEQYIQKLELESVSHNSTLEERQEQPTGVMRNSSELISGYVIRIPGEEGLFFTSYAREQQRMALRWNFRSSRYLAYDRKVEVVLDVYDLADEIMRDMETQCPISSTNDIYDIYSGSPALISIDNRPGLFYTHITKLPDGRYEVHAKRRDGSEETHLTTAMTCKIYLCMEDAAAQYIKRAEAAEHDSQT